MVLMAASLQSSFALTIETSSRSGSVAVGIGPRILAVERFSRPLIEASQFLPAVQKACEQANVKPEAIAFVYVSIGPGSFTGLRIGVTAARMLALACGARIVAVPTLEAIANNALELPDVLKHVAVILDAKRSHVYAQTFRLVGSVFQPTDEAAEVEPLEYLSSRSPDCGVMGGGIAMHHEAVRQSGRASLPESTYTPRAESVYALGFTRAERGEFVDGRALTPLYVRSPEAEERWAARQKNRS